MGEWLVDGCFEKLEDLRSMIYHNRADIHKQADQVLCDLLRHLGYNDLVDVYEDIDKEYGW